MASTRVASSTVSHAGVSLDIYLAANAPTLQEFGAVGNGIADDTDVSGSAGGNSIRCTGVTSAATIFLDGYNNEQGFADYGAATKKTASYV